MASGGISCESCGALQCEVVDSRANEDASEIRRRRMCRACGFRFSTYERRGTDIETQNRQRLPRRELYRLKEIRNEISAMLDKLGDPA